MNVKRGVLVSQHDNAIAIALQMHFFFSVDVTMRKSPTKVMLLIKFTPFRGCARDFNCPRGNNRGRFKMDVKGV